MLVPIHITVTTTVHIIVSAIQLFENAIIPKIVLKTCDCL